jgi:DNA-directed RNA polymerase delta subunit
MAFKLKYKNLKGVIEQLKGASKKHKKQADILEKHVDKMKSPLEQNDLGYTGVNFDPSAGYTTTGVKIPGFRDFVSLEQQKAINKRIDERRAKKRKQKEFKELEEAGGGKLSQEQLDYQRSTTDPEAVVKTPGDEENVLNINTSSNYGI